MLGNLFSQVLFFFSVLEQIVTNILTSLTGCGLILRTQFSFDAKIYDISLQMIKCQTNVNKRLSLSSQTPHNYKKTPLL